MDETKIHQETLVTLSFHAENLAGQQKFYPSDATLELLHPKCLDMSNQINQLHGNLEKRCRILTLCIESMSHIHSRLDEASAWLDPIDCRLAATGLPILSEDPAESLNAASNFKISGRIVDELSAIQTELAVKQSDLTSLSVVLQKFINLSCQFAAIHRALEASPLRREDIHPASPTFSIDSHTCLAESSLRNAVHSILDRHADLQERVSGVSVDLARTVDLYDGLNCNLTLLDNQLNGLEAADQTALENGIQEIIKQSVDIRVNLQVRYLHDFVQFAFFSL
ncbi:unnamed protein product [Protopolystoma xenopodis]|uniref:Uncharacterized protein n=1 Tax=Protopolystoma xenopodis TaxID=117903 RepID=A0A448XN78_9PLAT|nr:unnamed protein product [Protopolystoma xenopodis]